MSYTISTEKRTGSKYLRWKVFFGSIFGASKEQDINLTELLSAAAKEFHGKPPNQLRIFPDGENDIGGSYTELLLTDNLHCRIIPAPQSYYLIIVDSRDRKKHLKWNDAGSAVVLLQQIIDATKAEFPNTPLENICVIPYFSTDYQLTFIIEER